MQGSSTPARRLAAATFVAIFAVFAAVATPTAHEIPSDVLIHTFVKAEGQELRLLVRVPIAAMRDITWPLKENQETLELSGSRPTCATPRRSGSATK